MPLQNSLKTIAGVTFEELYERAGLVKLNAKFEEYLQVKNTELFQKFSTLKQGIDFITAPQKSQILIDVARILEDFIAELFDIEKENSELKKRHEDLKKIYLVRREFVQRVVSKKFTEVASDVDGINILKELEISYDDVDELEKCLAEKIFAEEQQ